MIAPTPARPRGRTNNYARRTGARLRHRREQLQLSVADAVTRHNVALRSMGDPLRAISSQVWYAWESGRTPPPLVHLPAIAKALAFASERDVLPPKGRK